MSDIQPVTGFNYTYIGTVGTIVLKDISARVGRLAIPGTYVGTVELYDCVGTAGTAATNIIGTFGLPLTNVMRSLELDITTHRGLVYVATGTPNVLLAWS